MSNPSIMSHVSVGASDMERALAFYDAVLAALGAERVFEDGDAVAYGREFPEFWVSPPHNGAPPSPGNGIHFAFLAPDKASVDAFYKAARAQGAPDEGAPGPRPHYGAGYYGCFVRDPDGHKIEATYFDETAE